VRFSEAERYIVKEECLSSRGTFITALKELVDEGKVVNVKGGEGESYYCLPAEAKHVKKFKDPEGYDMFLRHSRDLIPGTRALIYEVEERSLLGPTREAFVEDTCGSKLDAAVLDKTKNLLVQHLKIGYPRVWENIEELKGLEKKHSAADKELMRRVLYALRDPVDIPIDPSSRMTFEFHEVKTTGVEFSSERQKYRYVESLAKELATLIGRGPKPMLTFDEAEKRLEWDWAGITLARGVSREEAREIESTIERIFVDKGLMKKATETKQYETKAYKLRSKVGDELREIEAKAARDALDLSAYEYDHESDIVGEDLTPRQRKRIINDLNRVVAKIDLKL